MRKQKIARNAGDGQFVSLEDAAARPNETVVETVVSLTEDEQIDVVRKALEGASLDHKVDALKSAMTAEVHPAAPERRTLAHVIVEGLHAAGYQITPA